MTKLEEALDLLDAATARLDVLTKFYDRVVDAVFTLTPEGGGHADVLGVLQEVAAAVTDADDEMAGLRHG